MALVALWAAPARAQLEVATDPSPKELARERGQKQEEQDQSLVRLLRVGAAGYYFRGTRLVGYGSREPYHGVSGGLEIQGAHFPLQSAPWFGFEVALRFGAVTGRQDEYDGSVEAVVLAAPARWRGGWPGSFVVGLGPGLALSRPTWLPAGVQAYPLAVARLRLWPNRGVVSLHAQYRFTPVTTDLLDDLFVQVHDAEVAVGWKALLVAARCRIDVATGGDPVRTYNQVGCGPFIGTGLYW
jgi:hypothetical protein